MLSSGEAKIAEAAGPASVSSGAENALWGVEAAEGPQDRPEMRGGDYSWPMRTADSFEFEDP